MPFLGKDWRSCGDEWVKTEQGWERIKVLECILDNLNNGLVLL
jgi:F-box protein 25/32